MGGMDLVQDKKTGIVPVLRIFFAWITLTGKNEHGLASLFRISRVWLCAQPQKAGHTRP